VNRFLFVVFLIVFAAQADCAFADTVDAQAKPYMVLGGLVAGIGLSCVGIFFLWRGVTRRKLAARSLQWPVTDGKILASSVKEEIRHDAQGNRVKIYIPEARYSYAVARNRYEGAVIRPGIEQFGYGYTAAAQAQIEQYKPGTSVPVHYDPADPSIAVLQTSESGSVRNLIAGTLFFLVGIFGLVFAAWTASLDTQ
jgi:hypothetical protein